MSKPPIAYTNVTHDDWVATDSNEIRTLQETSVVLDICPVLIIDDDGGDFRRCGLPLHVVHTRTIRGDDYGSWPVHDAYLECGHTLDDIRSSLRVEEYL